MLLPRELKMMDHSVATRSRIVDALRDYRKFDTITLTGYGPVSIRDGPTLQPLAQQCRTLGVQLVLSG